MPIRTKLFAAALAALALFEAAGGLRPATTPEVIERDDAVAVAPRDERTTSARAKRSQRKPLPKRLVAVTDDDARRAPTRVERPAARRSPSDLERLYPKQWKAEQIDGEPATQHWALIIGIGDYMAAADTYGSRQDAQALRKHLLSLGWRSDHILLLTDRRATASRIVRAIRWLAKKSDASSTVVFHYAGHEKPLTRYPDGDDERRDVAIWATDNRLVVDGDLGRELGKVRARKMWVHFATCRAAGFDDPGTSKPGRVITYSSPEKEFSYEDPALRHSVFGYHTIVRGMRERLADANDDGRVTVEEAFAYARPRVREHTAGNQNPILVDRYEGSFTLRVPPKPAPAPSGPPTSPPDDDGCDLLVCPPSARRED